MKVVCVAGGSAGRDTHSEKKSVSHFDRWKWLSHQQVGEVHAIPHFTCSISCFARHDAFRDQKLRDFLTPFINFGRPLLFLVVCGKYIPYLPRFLDSLLVFSHGETRFSCPQGR